MRTDKFAIEIFRDGRFWPVRNATSEQVSRPGAVPAGSSLANLERRERADPPTCGFVRFCITVIEPES